MAERRPRAAAPLLLLALLAGAAFPGPAAGRVNPHAFMSDPARCPDCHEQKPERGRDDYTTVTFTASIVELCVKCHQGEHLREEHPVEIRPEYEVPEDFHLDNSYSITCATCHNAHGPHEADRPYVVRTFAERAVDLLARRRRFPTYFLRRPNPGGELCTACHRGGVVAGEGAATRAEQGPEGYVGSQKCRECHPKVYEEWRRTLHAYNFRDARREPASLLGDFGKAEGLAKDQVLWSVGAHWTQRYLVAGKKQELAVVPDTWSVQARTWQKEGSFNRSWIKYCAGCHVTALNPFSGTYAETGTGCEGCHGPGKGHAESADQAEIVNPSLLVEARRDMICESCHTAGHDRSGTFRYPVGFRPGENLMRYYRGLVPKPGQDVGNYTGDGTYEDRHRQFLFWISRSNILTGATCDICAIGRAPSAEMANKSTEYRLTPEELCGTCHREMILDQKKHANHTRAQAGCLDCHPPLLDESRNRYSIHDHKFQFAKPTPEHVAGGDPCQSCHERKRVKAGRAGLAAASGGARTR